MGKTILSIDCGTQSLRAMLFSPEGETLAIEKISYQPYISPYPGWAEQNPEVYWDALKEACLKLRAREPQFFGEIVGVGITSVRDSVVNVDVNGKPLRPAILWLDLRKAEPVYKPAIGMKLVIKAIGIGDSLRKAQREGKINWIKQNQPEIWEKTHKVLQVSGFLNYRLTGEFSDSVASQIGHIPFDYKKQKWASRKNILNFTSRLYPVEKEKLPEIIEPGKTLGYITGKASKETGLPEGLPVIACGSDKGCETLGVGVTSEKEASLSLGTTATIQVTSKKYLEPIPFMPSYPAVVPGWFNPEVEIFRGFWMITWFKNEFAHNEVEQAKVMGIQPEEVMNEMLGQAPPGSMGLVVQPFWSPGLSEPSAKGAMIGFGDVHKKPHVYRAVIEGLMFGLLDGKHKIEKVSKQKIRKIYVSGGASRSDEICRIAADVFNMPVTRGETTEASCLGAAMITGVGVGIFSNIDDAILKMVHTRDVFQPRKDNTEIYHRLYKKVYRKMYKKLKPFYKDIRKITGYPE